MALRKLTQVRGDTKNYGITFRKADGTPYCIKNWTVFFTLKTNIELLDASASLQKVITVFDDSVSGTSGSANIAILPSDTINLPVGEYDFDIAVCTNVNEHFTVMRGKYALTHNVTKTTGTAGTAA